MNWNALKDIQVDLYELGAVTPLGLLGEGDAPVLLDVAAVEKTLTQKGLSFKRHNLHEDPLAFIENEPIAELLRTNGDEAFPALMVNGALICTGHYPTQDEWIQALGLADFETGLSRVTPEELASIRENIEAVMAGGCGGCSGCGGGCGCGC